MSDPADTWFPSIKLLRGEESYGGVRTSFEEAVGLRLTGGRFIRMGAEVVSSLSTGLLASRVVANPCGGGRVSTWCPGIKDSQPSQAWHEIPLFLEEMHEEQAALGIHSWVADEAWLDLALRCLGVKVSKV